MKKTTLLSLIILLNLATSHHAYTPLMVGPTNLWELACLVVWGIGDTIGEKISSLWHKKRHKRHKKHTTKQLCSCCGEYC